MAIDIGLVPEIRSIQNSTLLLEIEMWYLLGIHMRILLLIGYTKFFPHVVIHNKHNNKGYVLFKEAINHAENTFQECGYHIILWHRVCGYENTFLLESMYTELEESQFILKTTSIFLNGMKSMLIRNTRSLTVMGQFSCTQIASTLIFMVMVTTIRHANTITYKTSLYMHLFEMNKNNFV